MNGDSSQFSRNRMCDASASARWRRKKSEAKKWNVRSRRKVYKMQIFTSYVRKIPRISLTFLFSYKKHCCRLFYLHFHSTYRHRREKHINLPGMLLDFACVLFDVNFTSHQQTDRCRGELTHETLKRFSIRDERKTFHLFGMWHFFPPNFCSSRDLREMDFSVNWRERKIETRLATWRTSCDFNVSQKGHLNMQLLYIWRN